jgi:hypothetical protein
MVTSRSGDSVKDHPTGKTGGRCARKEGRAARKEERRRSGTVAPVKFQLLLLEVGRSPSPASGEADGSPESSDHLCNVAVFQIPAPPTMFLPDVGDRTPDVESSAAKKGRTP